MVTSASPILATTDVQASVDFFKEVLGFQSGWTIGEPPEFGGASWGSATLFFSLDPQAAAGAPGQTIWLNVEGVNDLHAIHVERGAPIVEAISDKPWGYREYTVQDPSGYRLRFAEVSGAVPAPSREMPATVSITRRMPTPEEYAKVAGSTFYPGGAALEAYDRTWRGVVAEHPEDGAIGTVRIMCDAPGWYSIWDVAVLPEWQGQHVGNAMMKEAMAMVREEAPGAHVFLFTYKQGFYEKLGFGKGSVTIAKV